jgi:hypothetical protein
MGNCYHKIESGEVFQAFALKVEFFLYAPLYFKQDIFATESDFESLSYSSRYSFGSTSYRSSDDRYFATISEPH